MKDIDSSANTARYMDVSESWLRKARCNGDGPAFCKFGKSVRYRKVDVDAYAIERQRHNTINRKRPEAD